MGRDETTTGRRSTRLIAAAAIVVVVVAAGSFAYASIPASDGMIYGCYSRSGGALRVIDGPTSKCKSGETSLNWNNKGEPGPVGPAGPTGATGATGPTGSQGPQGVAGTNGINGINGLNGETGPRGPQGQQGDKGDTGDKGDQGDQGDQGDPGATGATGATGSPGRSHFEIREQSFQVPVGDQLMNGEVSCGPGERASGGGYIAPGYMHVLLNRPTTFLLEPDAGEPAGWQIGVYLSEPASFAGSFAVYVICASDAEPERA